MTTAEGIEQLTPAGARQMYQRVLAGWAMDLLTLRRAGLDQPGRRGAWARGGVAPELAACGAVRLGARRWDTLPGR